MIKMFAFDLDGTLLKSDQSIDVDTLNLLKKLSKEGRKIVLATGRNFSMVEGIVLENELECDLILNSGHEILVDDQKIYYPFEWEVLEKVLNILIENDVYMAIYGRDQKKYSFLSAQQYYDEHIRLSRAVRGDRINKFMHTPLFKYESYTENLITLNTKSDFKSVNILKIDAKTLDKDNHTKSIQQLSQIPNIELSSSFESYIEVTQNNSNKATALLQLAKQYDIQLDEICAFGDSSNDIEMLKTVPHSYAMGNASNEAKKVAKYVTDTNENQGIYKALCEILEEEQKNER
ncbi:hypothetical protein AN639_00090 [Candidatus Epulonipiscium fishelsonii]|uniref:Uncharacterized protein n=2 Tax=Candidatus Epulonipiscium fishelsonii TaxID=77094 RepID=A0ACC8XEI4_9FIRM|nr:hypothetical protein AN396_06015 [Epulopiscium sp. SCG-B11WGA-EpuloA1]ONI41615.1 hypothetical protein AN396_03400 [Epulopiscium sp. SCG-B11WGA-EpuloA1]ONI43927.1 hypothetical protein AN639_00090 [Epulopiscium sp. SCG-B05WGA-EpuloA1]ONI47929.1 hypothetical protein AN644_03380 [Epulopiscium sp. SCG-C06WGA-EpuloA1]